MIHKTRGIVFRYTKFRETSIIVSIFTELFGLRSYIVNGVRSSNKSSGNKIALYQPLTLLDLVVYNREQANINRIKEVKCLYPYRTIGMDVRKSTLCMFLNEVMNKSIREESHAQEVFDFIYEAFVTLDEMDAGTENFHIIFLIKLSRFLGFGPQHTHELSDSLRLDADTEKKLGELLHCDFDFIIPLSLKARREILDCVLKFYAEHIDTFGEVKSLQILREIFS